MSLDERTLDWLKKRATESCESCRTFCEITRNICSRDPKPKALAADFFSLSGCDLVANWQDCAEFEALVAAKLATYEYTDPCQGKTRCPYAGKVWNCSRCNLKSARLAVEAEMEMEKNNEKQSA